MLGEVNKTREIGELESKALSTQQGRTAKAPIPSPVWDCAEQVLVRVLGLVRCAKQVNLHVVTLFSMLVKL